ncbi:MAG: xanthine dehydrogenase family protein molybdopterin-binding subunit [Acidimicrobiales bacterium]
MSSPVEAPAPTGSWIGERHERLEDARLVRGLGRFVDDQEPAGLVYMVVGRCPYAHARIRGVDSTGALEIPGVLAVLTGGPVVVRTDPISVLRPLSDVPAVPYYAMAESVGCFEGQPVVAVVAEDRYLAEDALDAIVVEYEPLAAVVSAEGALDEGSPVIHPSLGSNVLVTNLRSEGDPDAALAGADVVVGDRFSINRVTGLPMEGRACLATYTRGVGDLDVWSSTQLPHLVRMQLSQSLRMPDSRIRVRALDVGGGFGLKLGLYPEEVLTCLFAIDLGRPVKWVEDRMENFRMTTHARQAVHRADIGATRDGRIVVMRDAYLVDGGAFNSPFGSPMLSSLMFTGPYKVNDAMTERRVVVTNKTPVGAYRGYGQPESNFVRETLIDRLAGRLGLDPVELRRRNLLAPEDLPWKSPGGAMYDSGDYAKCMDMALDKIGYADFRRRQPALRASGERIGVGVANFVEMTGYPGSAFLGRHKAQFSASESVTIRMNRSGGCELFTGVSPFGQGTETSFAQIAASALGMRPVDVIVHAGDTRGTPYNTGGFASRTTIAGAGAILEAAREITAKVLRIAGHLLGVDPEGLEVVGGVVRARGGVTGGLALGDVAREAILAHHLPPGEPPGLEATAYFDPVANTFGYGTAASLVRVDERSGEFSVDRFVLVHDCGTEINPMLVEGQLCGGVAQAFGAAFFEELIYDPESGQLLNGTMVDYLMPTAADLPTFEFGHLGIPSPVTPLGVRGVGEAGTIPTAAAVVNAIRDALAPLDVVFNRLPVTAEAVWLAIEDARTRSDNDKEITA